MVKATVENPSDLIDDIMHGACDMHVHFGPDVPPSPDSLSVARRLDALGTALDADQAGNRRLMKGYLDPSSASRASVTVAGLASGTYDVYVYADGDNGGASRTGTYRLSGSGITTTSITLTDAANTNFAVPRPFM